MRNKLIIVLFTLVFGLVACGNEDANNLELKDLGVEFNVPEHIEVGETLELKAIVTYGDEDVTDADDVNFEVWEKGDRDNGKRYDATNNGDGTYTAEVTFDHDGIFEMYAHTTARDLHTMPKREIVVGEGGNYEEVNEETTFQTEGFDIHFMEVEDAKVDEEIELVVHVMLDEEHLADANVRYEIWSNDNEDHRDWIDALETDGEYVATHTFTEAGIFNIQIHVEDDEDLHEHTQYEIEVTD